MNEFHVDVITHMSTVIKKNVRYQIKLFLNQTIFFVLFAGTTGSVCETNLNNCQPNPCRRGARCLDWTDDFYCFCPNGTAGKICSTLSLILKFVQSHIIMCF